MGLPPAFADPYAFGGLDRELRSLPYPATDSLMPRVRKVAKMVAWFEVITGTPVSCSSSSATSMARQLVHERNRPLAFGDRFALAKVAMVSGVCAPISRLGTICWPC